MHLHTYKPLIQQAIIMFDLAVHLTHNRGSINSLSHPPNHHVTTSNDKDCSDNRAQAQRNLNTFIDVTTFACF